MYNILNPKDGKPVAVPTQDMVLGCYYLTIEKKNESGKLKVFANTEEAVLAYDNEVISLHEKIKVDYQGKLLETTVGRLIFNEALPSSLRYFNKVADKKTLGRIVDICYRKEGYARTAQLLDDLKRLGYSYATKAGVTIGISDITIPEEKKKILSEAEEKVNTVEKQYRRGFITAEERYRKVIETWNNATDEVTQALMTTLDKLNPVYMMATSGARGNIQQIRQLAGMRGLMADPSGRIIDLPIKANFREGLTVLEYFISTHGARKGLADTALRTADSGYLTRRLVDVSQDVIIREDDCGTNEDVDVAEIKDGTEVIENLEDRIKGRFVLQDIVHPKTGDVIVKAGEEIMEEDAKKIVEAGIEKVRIRSVLTCKTKHGVCKKCYGQNLATGKEVEIGEAVGIIAAQSIGEPGTQLTMRTFHTGGVAGEDITQGLPRIEELFEARKPKRQSVISEIDGKVSITENKEKVGIEVISDSGDIATYQVPFGSRIKVKNGDYVEAGDELTEGSINPHDLMKIKGRRSVQMYLLQEVQRVYRLQGVEINDKHIEIMIRQMLKKVKIIDAGDTDLLPGSLVDILDFMKENERVEQFNGEKAVAVEVLLGITKASLATDSFLSAASFQETTRVLTDASIKGKVDSLLGLKENVIIGKLIPAGTGIMRYRNTEITDA